MPLYSEDPRNPMPEHEPYTIRSAKSEANARERLRTFRSGILTVVILAAIIFLLYSLYAAVLKQFL